MQLTIDKKFYSKLRTHVDKTYRKQMPFAISKAINQTAKDIAPAMAVEAEQAFNAPTPFTKKATKVEKWANKRTLTAIVGMKPQQNRYMSTEIKGGPRRQTATARRFAKAGYIPSNMYALPGKDFKRRNKYGNITRGQINKWFEACNKPGSNIFTINTNNSTGVWLLVQRTRGSEIRSLLAFLPEAPEYSKRFDWKGTGQQVVNAKFPFYFRKAIIQAIRTAK